ncbi:ABC transporter substrate-binding protein [Vibrio sp. IRLE0018]|uniref:substrate-binding periplasmic protein n=1 Tax=Vibrio floridensis TaxID=2908007 RepID=UPI001F1FE463|nr:transporter substrate-binding domain-containing protein [Vibrio floridensis]MCF8777247.1 ABC transporter substrate-binding protein [Vibrio floridensis]
MKVFKWTYLSLCAWSLTPSAHSDEVNYYVIANQARPFQIEVDGQHQEGIVTDIVKSIFAQSEHTVNYHTYPFNRMISILDAGGEQNWLTYGSPSWGKAQSENLSEEPIYTVKHTLVTSSQKPFSFQGIEDLKNKGVVLLMGFDYPQLTPYIEQGYLEEIRVKDYQAAFRVVSRTPGETAFVEMTSRVNYNIRQLRLNPTHYSQQPFELVVPDYDIYLAFSPSMDSQLQAFINRRLKEIKQSGELQAIIDKYI